MVNEANNPTVPTPTIEQFRGATYIVCTGNTYNEDTDEHDIVFVEDAPDTSTADRISLSVPPEYSKFFRVGETYTVPFVIEIPVEDE